MSIGVHGHRNGSLSLSTYGRYPLMGGFRNRRFDFPLFQKSNSDIIPKESSFQRSSAIKGRLQAARTS